MIYLINSFPKHHGYLCKPMEVQRVFVVVVVVDFVLLPKPRLLKKWTVMVVLCTLTRMSK